jgi:hypothetical protein
MCKKNRQAGTRRRTLTALALSCCIALPAAAACPTSEPCAPAAPAPVNSPKSSDAAAITLLKMQSGAGFYLKAPPKPVADKTVPPPSAEKTASGH